jgi:phosphoesterase RecJ-like protein
MEPMWDKIAKLINTYESFLITTHINPDGDAVGSEVALKAFLEDRDKNVVIVNSSATPQSLTFLDPDNEIKIFPYDVKKEVLDEVDAVFILDVNNREHLGSFGRLLESNSHPSVCIDHHEGAENDLADIIANDTTVAATGILIYDLIRSMKGNVTRAIADAVYAAIITDTGTFRFSNTDARAFKLAAELCDRGVNPFEIHRHVFGSKTWGAGNLLGPVLGTVETAADGRLAWIHVTQKMINDAGAIYDDTDGFVDLVRAIKGVELVLFFKEIADDNVKVSLRSNGRVNAFAIAEGFGGGGHKMASGMKVDGPVEKAIETVVAACMQLDVIKNPPD